MSKLKEIFVKWDKVWDKSPNHNLINKLYWLTILLMVFYLMIYFMEWSK